MALRLLTRAACASAAALWAGPALACASCAMRQNDPGRQLLSLGMIVLPFTVVGASAYAIRRMAKNEYSNDGSVAVQTGDEGRK